MLTQIPNINNIVITKSFEYFDNADDENIVMQLDILQQVKLEYIRLLEAAKVEWIDAYKYSKIWYCIKFKKCKYLPEIYNKIISYEKNNY